MLLNTHQKSIAGVQKFIALNSGEYVPVQA